MKVEFGYDKGQVIQALRYHFISKRELRLMIILVNVFALISLVLYFMKLITPMAFLVNSVLWMALMVSVWFILPGLVYRRSETFRNRFTMYFHENDFTLEHENGRRNWPYSALKFYKESPKFFHLYFDERSFWLVPKDDFETYKEISDLRDILKSKVG